ncbi:SusC/RagA family TonB-linked outer membrane protein [Echinicola soli]|nr:SusC/RagA family TonB-linked outer membrane protein [Echinicola soli]
MKKLLLCIWLLISIHESHGQDGQYRLHGRIKDAVTGSALPGATVQVKGTQTGTASDAEGFFTISGTGLSTLTFSFVGYRKQELEVDFDSAPEQVEILLMPGERDLEGVEVVSTGYRQLPLERATGSFVALDEELVNRKVSTNLIDRLEDVTPGLVFNRSAAEGDPISIRGRSTLFAETHPLVVIDNFPYDGPLENINPNDVESITVLRDAAAASIWGAQAGNGVIVITTKQGRKGTPRISLNANVTVAQQPDPFYRPRIASADMVDIEQRLFGEGYYGRYELSSNQTPLSPAVEALIAHRDGKISDGELEEKLGTLSLHDSRSDLERHYYRPEIRQQYSLGIRGGSEGYRYAFSAGYDRNRANIRGNSESRLTLMAKNSWRLFDDRLEIMAGISHIRTMDITGTELPSVYPYEALGDNNGVPLPVIRGYSSRFISSVRDDGLLDWRYYPLQEIGLLDGRDRFMDLRLNSRASYRILPGLKASLLHQYWQGDQTDYFRYPRKTFHVRDLVNQFTQVDGDGTRSFPVPKGDILDWGITENRSHHFRGQLDYARTFGEHEFSALAGFEAKDLSSNGRSARYYGYDDALGISQPVDYGTRYRTYYNPGRLSNILSGEAISGKTDRFVSYYLNLGYHFRDRFGLSLSARKDASNLFGVDANQKGVPLWSVGTSWTVSEEGFMDGTAMDYLKVRLSYGYNGNIDRSVTAYTTARYRGGNLNRITGLPMAQIINPPNPDLSWERIGILNLGLDFELWEGRLSGTVEAYRKEGTDLIGDSPVGASSGFLDFRGNFADTRTHGMDLELRSQNLTGDTFRWSTNLMVSTVSEKVTRYGYQSNVSTYLRYGDGGGPATPMEGRPLYAIYSYPWAGLDPDMGAPLGYVNGEKSDDYASITGNATMETVNYHGSARPTLFGALRNDIAYGNLSLSVNISFRSGYHYRRNSVDYNELLRGNVTHADYGIRWKRPGDEVMTHIPSLPDGLDTDRDNFYRYAGILVEKGDHIRLQDIRLGYRPQGLPLKNTEIYVYANNLGIIWKAAKDDPLDPDYRSAKPLGSISLGIRVDL